MKDKSDASTDSPLTSPEPPKAVSIPTWLIVGSLAAASTIAAASFSLAMYFFDFATKGDMRSLETQLSAFAQKSDLHNLVTVYRAKEFGECVELRLSSLHSAIEETVRQIQSRFDRQPVFVAALMKRVEQIEPSMLLDRVDRKIALRDKRITGELNVYFGTAIKQDEEMEHSISRLSRIETDLEACLKKFE